MEKRIYYYDTDAGGVVYYGNYLKYLEEARTELLEQKGLSIEAIRKRGFLYAVRKCTITYISPARYGDTIVCDAALTKITAARMFFQQKIFNKATGQLIAEAEIVLVSLTPDFKPTSIPDDLKELISAP